jgi:hypothetical protein
MRFHTSLQLTLAKLQNFAPFGVQRLFNGRNGKRLYLIENMAGTTRLELSAQLTHPV